MVSFQNKAFEHTKMASSLKESVTFHEAGSSGVQRAVLLPQAELCLQFHDDPNEQYSAQYHATRGLLEARGRILPCRHPHRCLILTGLNTGSA